MSTQCRRYAEERAAEAAVQRQDRIDAETNRAATAEGALAEARAEIARIRSTVSAAEADANKAREASEEAERAVKAAEAAAAQATLEERARGLERESELRSGLERGAMEAAAKAEAARVELARLLTERDEQLADAAAARDELKAQVDGLSDTNGDLTGRVGELEGAKLRVAALEAAVVGGGACSELV